MALTSAEQKEMLKLSAKCLDPKDWETPLPDADKKDLRRLAELLKRLSAQPEDETGEPHPIKIKNYVMSAQAKALVEQGAEFQGAEQRNHGTDEVPKLVIREWLYVGKGDDRHCCFVQTDGRDIRVIDAGKTIAASAYRRFQKP